ncbi:MAG: tryptophan--tRNA ligase [Candidatus Thermoplasmatota archaeon]|jgi:tryptophanyl-tRNA synthetase|nr:tryptophan--tRNA ligase [Candidatus Thermoplasmatota archaeon]MEC8519814.1 tryptophan--tRNA ligase [Candidatus Thermoplasmatota archaeon]MEC8816937.1 tryptophan--tRNA ligase [Candidatus Thermoplasmatota archaeon]MEE2648029.1 tryptophan--tRNA ligase [Candidatus Thermoplasmatota archaeon]MEE3084528.1 tryptophan--tRNA ligase [Candidatus Thermoplasmatota archaeon]
MAQDDLVIDPWGSAQSTDYDRIIDRFGLTSMEGVQLDSPSKLHRRGIVFAHRDVDQILEAQRTGAPFGVLTGLMPSGQMHLGHSMVVEQARWFQQQGGDVTIAVADLESQATRGVSLAKGRTVALEEYISHYAALGLDPAKTNVYFQSTRPVVQRLGFQLGKRTNLSEFEAIYGFGGETNLAHVQAPLVQVGDILHPQIDEYGGLRPIVVPVGVDQDPHLRLTRGLASKTNWFNLRESSSRGWLVSLSVHDENAEVFGQLPNGRVDKAKVAAVFDRVVEAVAALGFSDIMSSPKQGTVHIPSATSRDKHALRMALLRLERSLGGPGLMAPSSTYHHFAVGMTGDKMSSSQPKTTLFLRDDIATVEKKIKRAFSGGQPTVEEHRRLGGNPDIDVAYQYMMYFFEEDDAYLSEINAAFRAGTLLAGEMKQLCIERATAWMANLHEMRDQTAHQVSAFLAEDSR